MEAIEKLARTFPAGWGVTRSRWRKGGHAVAFDNSPFAYHPPELAQDIVSGRLTHPIAEQIRGLSPGKSITISEREILDMQPAGAEMFQAMTHWAMRDGGYSWEYTLEGDWIIRKQKAPIDPAQ
jgi:hypothetical protein